MKAKRWNEGSYTIAHCGHPTALWPYYLLHQNGGGMILSPNGLGFQTLAMARAAAKLLDNGTLIVAPRVCLVGRTKKSGLRFDPNNVVVMLRGSEHLMENRPIIEVITLLQSAGGA